MQSNEVYKRNSFIIYKTTQCTFILTSKYTSSYQIKHITHSYTKIQYGYYHLFKNSSLSILPPYPYSGH